MHNFEFVGVELTPEEKHLGIITVTGTFKMLLRYKIVPTKDGKSKFPAPATYKMAEDRFISAFQIDSASEHEKLMNFLKEKISQYFEMHSVNSFTSSIGDQKKKNSTSDRDEAEHAFVGPPNEELPF